MTQPFRVFFGLLFWILTLSMAVPAQDSGEIPQSAIDRATRMAADSVVQIETIGTVEQAGQQLSNAGPTTGTVIGEEGWILASSLNFQPMPAAIMVRTKDGHRQTAKVVARDRNRELVLLKTDVNPLLRPIESAKIAEIQVGQTVIALGKAFDPMRPSVSVGIVSATGRVWGKAIQTDARISPTNYGGPLVDLQGKCVGILAPISPGDNSGEDGTQWYDSGIGFAASIDQVMRSLDTLKSGKDLYPGRLGVSLSTQDDYAGPVYVVGAAANSPAAAAGLKRGDRILEINSAPIELLAHLKLQLGILNAGDTVQLKVQRSQTDSPPQVLEMQCVLVDEIPPYRRPYLGIVPAQDMENQVVVRMVLANTPAAKMGLAVGDRIAEVNGAPITSIGELSAILQTQSLDKPLSLRWQRGESLLDAPQAISLEPWPVDPLVKLSEDEKPNAIAPPAAAGTGVIDLPLGDVPNKCFAFVPPSYRGDIAHGVMILIPEAGDVDQRALLDQWEPLCRAHRWILAVLTSAAPKAWSREEIELVGRTLTLLQTNYTIDPQRVACIGIRSAAPLAIVAAFGQRTKFNALVVLGSDFPVRGSLPAAQPFESLRTLIVNESETGHQVAETLTELGHPTSTLQAVVEVGGKLPQAQNEILQLWLRGLERL